MLKHCCNHLYWRFVNFLQEEIAKGSEKKITKKFNMQVYANTFHRYKFILKGILGRRGAHLHGKRAILTGQKTSL